MSKFLFVFWPLIALLVFVYSYGFVDLNLTLSSHPLIFNFVSYMQQLVYFDRQLSHKIFIALILLMFIGYLGLMRYWSDRPFPWRIVIILSVIFALAYPMLSSDVFKYLFGAKEILVYHANPYLVTPDSFPEDTWIRFMRWVHTTSPYGPVFIGLTIPYYLLGMGKFVPILYLFKLDQVAWYLLTIWLIGKIATQQKWSNRSTVMAQLFFAFNPLVLMEWLVNAHNDAIMMGLLMASIYLYQLQKNGWSLLTILLSAGIKYVTIIFLPFILIVKIYKPKLAYIVSFLLSALALVPLLYHYSWQYQPWYVTWLIPLTALTPHRTIRYVVGAYSLSVFTRYLYFVGTGSWLGTPIQHALMTFTLPILTAIIMMIYSVSSASISSSSRVQHKSTKK